MTDLAHVLDEPRRMVDALIAQSRGGATTTSPAAVRAANNSAAREFVRTMRWTLTVPGKHADGIAYDILIQRLADQGRDLLHDSVQIRQAVRSDLVRFADGTRRLLLRSDLEKRAATTIREWITDRRQGQGNGDARMTSLTAQYAAQKARKGRGGQPVTVATGDLRRAISRFGQVKFT